MKFRCSHICFALFAIVLVSCSTRSDEYIIEVGPTSDVPSIETAGIIDEMQLIRLETNDDCLIGRIDKIIATDDRLFVADFSITQSVFVFDLTGKYISKISRRGRSQNEYNSLQDIFFDNEDNTINLMSRGKSKVLKFDTNGVFIEMQELPAEFIEIECNKNFYYATTGFYAQEWCKNNNLVKFDKDGSFRNGWFQVNSPQGVHRLYDNIYQYDGNVYYVDNWMFLVNNISDGTQRYKFHFARGAQRPEFLNDVNIYKNHIDTNQSVNEYITSIDQVQETDEYVLASYIYNGSCQMAVHNKHSNQTESFNLGFMENFYALPFGTLVGVNESYMVSYISAKRVKNMQQGYNEYNDFRNEYPKQIAKLQAMFPPISEDDNPFVAIYRLH